MKAPNHLLGGQILTALCCSLNEINLFQSPTYIGLTALMSILPDIDLPKSIIGRVTKPISRWINRRYGHRTITHSISALLGVTIIIAILDHTILSIGHLATITFFAYLSHLIFDMMTLQGVPLLYPFTKNPFVIPGNPSFRIHTGDRRAETIIFCTFLLLAILLRPLFYHGFWTSYNRLFGTLEHLGREYRRSANLLLVDYQIRKGSELLKGQGYCIEADDKRAVIIENNQFRIIDTKEFVVEEVIPEATEKHFFYHRQAFTQIPADSLNRILAGKLITELEVHSNNPFIAHHQNQSTQQHTFKAQYLKYISFTQEPDSLSTASSSPQTRTKVYNPRIPILQQRLQSLRQENQAKHQQWQDNLQYLNHLQDQLTETVDIVRREQLFNLIQSARKVKPPKINYAQELEWETEIRELQKAEVLRNEERLLKITPSPPVAAPVKGMTGWVVWVEVKAVKEVLTSNLK